MRKEKTRKSSKYRGVSFNRWADKWEAYIGHLGKKVYLGKYKTQKAAALAYNEAARDLRGREATFNKVK